MKALTGNDKPYLEFDRSFKTNQDLNLTYSSGSFLVIVAISGAIALYIYRSLQPLRQLNQMTADISAADLPQVQLSVDRAPS